MSSKLKNKEYRPTVFLLFCIFK